MYSLCDYLVNLRRLNGPASLSRFISLSEIYVFSQARSFWEWLAMLLLLIAAVRCVPNRVARPLFSRPLCKSQETQSLLEEDDDWSSCDDDDACSLSSVSSGGDEDAGEPLPEPDGGGPGNHGVDWWSAVAGGGGVVRLWDGLGLGSDEEKRSGSLSPSWDSDGNSDEVRGSPIPAASPALIVSAVAGEARNLVLSVWDRRNRRRSPAILADWWPKEAARFDPGCVSKACVGDCHDGYAAGEVRICDLRKVSSAAGKTGGGACWDAVSLAGRSASVEAAGVEAVVTRWRDAVRFYLS